MDADPDRFHAELEYAPPIAGVARARIRAQPLPLEVTPDDNWVDVQLEATARRLKVLAHEPRPSWATTFCAARSNGIPRLTCQRWCAVARARSPRRVGPEFDHRRKARAIRCRACRRAGGAEPDGG
jgi:hypothetical protein